ncbi:hypothetical protein AgCh_025082 [Apium graveolens]
MQLRGPLVGPDRWWYYTLLKGTVRETLTSYGSAPESGPPFPLTNGPRTNLSSLSLSRPAELVVDNRSDLVKIVAAPVVGQRTYRDARGPIYDVSVADVRPAGRVDWPGSSSANETSIPKPSEYLFDRRLYLYGEFAADRSHPVSPSFPRRLPTRGSIQ